ncbi:MAG: transposase [Candidatus Cloacimonetes bacterium]|nr:transposase [Candidatus Cloacimonadota bacterium]
MQSQFSKRPTLFRYSETFKLKVVDEIEKGKLTIRQASQIYEINGGATIYGWLKKYGKNHLIRKVVRVEMKNEKDIIKAKDEKIRELEQALAALTVQNICQKCYIETVESRLTEEEKKLHFHIYPQSKDES